MSDLPLRVSLMLSTQRALLGAVHPQLRQVSIDADETKKLISLRFEYDGKPQEEAQESCSCAATEVIADFSAPWDIFEEHISVPMPLELVPLRYIAYLRAEPKTGT
nr:hypothetical protein [Pseudomonas benzenivorans]